MDPDGDLVRHRPGGDEQGGLFAGDLGRLGLEGVDRGVLAIGVVADFGLGHCTPHPGGRAGQRVASDVDGFLRAHGVSP